MTIDPFEGAGESTPTLKFPALGTAYTGTITEIQYEVQGTVYKSDPPKPATWDDGNPKTHVVITLDIGLAGQPEHGSLWALYWGNKGAGDKTFQALKAARAEAGGKPFAVGGTLQIAYTGNDGDAKVYTAKYKAPLAADPFKVAADTLGATVVSEAPF